MNEVATSHDQMRRKAQLAEVQRIFARELPAMTFAFPRLWFALNRRIGGASLAPFRPPVLWNPAVLSVQPDAH